MVLRFLSDFSRPFNGGGEDFGEDEDDDDEMTSLKSGTQTATLQLCNFALLHQRVRPHLRGQRWLNRQLKRP